jgi:hypothetical protein
VRTFRDYRIQLFVDPADFELNLRCVDALEDEGTLVFGPEMCVVRPIGPALAAVFAAKKDHKPTSTGSTVLLRVHDFDDQASSEPSSAPIALSSFSSTSSVPRSISLSLPRAHVRIVITDVARALRALHAEVRSVSHRALTLFLEICQL